MNEKGLKRKYTHPVKVGDISIGGNFPIAVQTMWKQPLQEVDRKLINRIKKLKDLGCDILRFAVPDEQAAHLLGELSKISTSALVADVHFDYKLALIALDYPVAKIRINPGNIGAKWKVKEVILKAKDREVPIRVGVNSGSLPFKLRQLKNTAHAMLEAAEQELEICEQYNFKHIIFSLKSSDAHTTIKANTLFSERYDYPLHLGVTEAGPLIPGIIKNTAALYTLLRMGIGDTIRVSLSSDSVTEIEAAKAIIKTVGYQTAEPNIISCPTCGRTIFPVKDFYEKIKGNIEKLHKDVTIAIMGCPVNGPGEARAADLGITGTQKHVIIFKQGKVIRRELIKNALSVFLEELDRIHE
ncbi:MAG: flavodoxin-dependent (E)-4-hydroxy-3-methylbut-2-enyl-diphosphate synthase [Spirochaetales bacterium]|nr:flavodoxin-dependent (E)-4-hydroxy-3-methylbut-2-enyl-diphosphate synthase [Spirochaetales bacterium]